MTNVRGFLVVLIASGLLAGCSRDHKRVVAVIPKGRAHLYWQSIHGGAAKAARENDVEIIWNGPPTEVDYNGQLQIVDAMINRRVDAIVLAPIDRKVMVAAVDRAARERIPVVIFDSAVDTPNFVAQVATDNYRAGQLGAERVGAILKGRGKILMVACQPGAASTDAREKGFEDKIRADFPGIQIADKRFGMADFAQSMTITENMLAAHPDVDAIFASNESSTVGATRALKSSGKHVRLVGFDWSPALLDGVATGEVDSLVVQDPFQMGYQSTIAAVRKLNGQPVEKIQDLAPKLVTKANLNRPDIYAQLHPDLKKYLGQ